MKIKVYDSLVVPPQIPSFGTLGKKEAQAFFDWYVTDLPTLSKPLFEHLQSEIQWQPDCSPSSLSKLEIWVATNVEFQKCTNQGSPVSSTELPSWFKKEWLSDQELTPDSRLLSLYISRYVAEVFITCLNASWKLTTRKSTVAGAQQPTLIWASHPGYEFIPIHSTLIAVEKTAEQDETHEFFQNLFEHYASNVTST